MADDKKVKADKAEPGLIAQVDAAERAASGQAHAYFAEVAVAMGSLVIKAERAPADLTEAEAALAAKIKKLLRG